MNITMSAALMSRPAYNPLSIAALCRLRPFLHVIIVLASLSISVSAWTWSDILNALNNATKFNDGNFRFDDNLWDSSNGKLISLAKIQQVIGCPEADEFGTLVDPYGYSRIPTEENTWTAMYEAYHATVDATEATIPREGHQHNAFVMPVEAKYAPYVGRGVKAATYIPQGTMVWRPRNAAEFTNVRALRLFLEHILTHSTTEVACDAVRWLYTSKASPVEDHYVLCIDFDEGSMINRAANDEELNIAQLVHSIEDEKNRVYGCQEGSLYATRDIQPGEELRMDYLDFAEGYGFNVFGLDPSGL